MIPGLLHVAANTDKRRQQSKETAAAAVRTSTQIKMERNKTLVMEQGKYVDA